MPLLDQLLNLSAGFVSTEKRILTPKPVFHFPHAKTYIVNFTKYYRENFGWRNALYYQYSHWKYNVLGVSPLPDKVIIGKNGWFYPGNSIDNVASQHRGFSRLSPVQLSTIANRLRTYQQTLARQGVKLYVFIAPDSYSIYPEYLPDNFHLSADSSNLDRLKQWLSQQTAVPFIDPRPDLLAAKGNRLLYLRTDTHWNQYGALVATLPLANRLRRDFPAIPAARLTDYQVRATEGAGGDLVMMLALNQEHTDSVLYHIIPSSALVANQVAYIEEPETGLVQQRFMGTDKARPKLLLLGDSFSYALNQPLSGFFREMYVVRDKTLVPDLVKREKPDIVVIEIVERNIGFLVDL